MSKHIIAFWRVERKICKMVYGCNVRNGGMSQKENQFCVWPQKGDNIILKTQWLLSALECQDFLKPYDTLIIVGNISFLLQLLISVLIKH